MAIGDSQELKFKVLAQVVGAESIDKLKGQIGGLSNAAQGINSRLGGLATGIKALAGAFVVKEIVSFGKGLIDAGDELQALSEKTGITVRDLSGFKAAAELGNTSLAAVETGARKLALAMVDASNGGKQSSAAFRSVGIAIKDASGQIRPTGDVIKDIADKFAKMEDGPQKAALAVKLFGKSGTELIPFLNQGSEALTRFGLAIDDDFAARADQFNDTISIMGNQFRNALLPAIETLLPVFQDILNAFTSTPDSGEDVVGVFEAIGEAVRITAIVFDGFVTSFRNGLDTLISFSKIAGSAITGFLATIGDAITTRASQLKALASLDFEGASALGDGLDKRSIERGKAAADEREKIVNDLSDRIESRTKSLAERTDKLLKNSLLFGEGSKDEIQKRLKDATAPAPIRRGGAVDTSELGGGGAGAKNAQDYDRIKNFIELQAEENRQRREALGDINLEAQELNRVGEARKFDLEIKKMTKSMNLTEEQKKQIELLREERLALIDLQFEQQRSFGYGAKSFFREYVADATNAAKQAEQVLGTAFKGAEDAFVNFVKTGKLSFKDLANAIIEDLIRISIRRALAGLVANVIGSAAGAGAGGASASANGNVITKDGPMPLRKYAMGGIANSPHVALFGEGSTPEAFVPLPDGRTIPVTMKGQSGNNVNVNVNVNVESGKSEVSQDRAGALGKELGAAIVNTVRTELINQKRPGGILARA